MNGDVSLSKASESASIDAADDLSWTVAKALLDANARSVRAFEQHLLWTYYRTERDHGETKRSLRQAIEQHERIVEELELAVETIDEMG